MVFEPQDGLPSLRMAMVQWFCCAIWSVFSAPRKKFSVTSLPSTVRTRSPMISAGGRGVESPPSSSGHTGTSSYFSLSFLMDSFSLFLPEYLQLTPSRQALTNIFCIETSVL